MPELRWLCLTVLLHHRISGSYAATPEALGTVSRDRFTRPLRTDWAEQTLLELACRTLFV